MVRASLGDAALAIEHIGSTSVPGLAAKPVVDVDLTVSDPADEAAYVPLAAAKETTEGGGLVTDYNRHKEPVLRAIYERMFRARGLRG